jgi:hypothetical protein
VLQARASNLEASFASRVRPIGRIEAVSYTKVRRQEYHSMSIELQTAFIAGLVALFTALLTSGISGYIAWQRVRRERIKWLIDLKAAYLVELHKVRLREYPAVIKIIGRLSTHASELLSPQKCHAIADDLNGWFYSAGGLCADQSTRRALLGLRESCRTWSTGPFPLKILEWRDATSFLLRRDLDLKGLESFDPKDMVSILDGLKHEMKVLELET